MISKSDLPTKILRFGCIVALVGAGLISAGHVHVHELGSADGEPTSAHQNCSHHAHGHHQAHYPIPDGERVPCDDDCPICKFLKQANDVAKIIDQVVELPYVHRPSARTTWFVVSEAPVSYQSRAPPADLAQLVA